MELSSSQQDLAFKRNTPTCCSEHANSKTPLFYFAYVEFRCDLFPRRCCCSGIPGCHMTRDPPPNLSGLLTYPCVVNKMLSLIPVCVFCKRSWFSRHFDLHNGDLSDDREDVGSQSGEVVVTCSGKKEWDVIRFLFFANFIWTSFLKNHFAAKRSCELRAPHPGDLKNVHFTLRPWWPLRGRKKKTCLLCDC